MTIKLNRTRFFHNITCAEYLSVLSIFAIKKMKNDKTRIVLYGVYRIEEEITSVTNILSFPIQRLTPPLTTFKEIKRKRENVLLMGFNGGGGVGGYILLTWGKAVRDVNS